MPNRILVAWRSAQREKSQKGTAYAAGWFLRRFYYRYLHGRLKQDHADRGLASPHPMSIVVPAVEKDAEPLKHCLAAANDMIRDPVKAKWVIGPESATIRTIAAEAGWALVNEDNLLPRPANELKCRGWVLQQLIKFHAAWHVPTEDYLVLDADTIFLRLQSFFRDGKTVLRYSDQYELLYNRSLELIFGHNHRFPVSFVTHHMMFNRNIVKELLSLVEQRFGRKWWEAFLADVDRGHPISFSEYELYGNYIVSEPGWKKRFFLEYWKGLEKYNQDFPQFAQIRVNSRRNLNCVSFHWHTQ